MNNRFNPFNLFYGQESNMRKPYLKMSLRVIERSHEGYCSGMDEEDDGDEEICLNEFLYSVPGELTDDNFDENGFLIKTDATEYYFNEWKDRSECEGSGYCNFKDTFTPLTIQRIV